MWWWLVAIACLIYTSGISEEFKKRIRNENPELRMNTSEMIIYRGYPSEEYEILTDDGYYLIVNRIPGGKKNPDFRGPKPVVLLQHGLLGGASNWIFNMPNKSLGFILVDAGYDVWLGNNRGTRWSKRHQNFSNDKEEYWDFSFHEMAMYDLPAMINFILTKTGQKDLHYIGHSQGCGIGFIAFSAMPELSQKIKMVFALAPSISLKHSSSPVIKLLAVVPENTVKFILGKKGFTAFLRPVQEFLSDLCGHSVLHKLCAYFLLFYGGYNANQLNMSRVDIYLDHFPDRTSVKTLLHWKQIRESQLFRYFDYGSENQAKYNQPYPPSYDIEEMAVPTAVWSGGEDLIADPEDMKILLPRITNLVEYHNFPDWNHWTFAVGPDAPKSLYCKIIQMMEKSL